MDNVNITLNRLFTPVKVIWQGLTNLEPGEILWLDGNRRSSLGGYVGTFRRTYHHSGNMVSPTGPSYQTPMRNVKEVPK